MFGVILTRFKPILKHSFSDTNFKKKTQYEHFLKCTILFFEACSLGL